METHAPGVLGARCVVRERQKGEAPSRLRACATAQPLDSRLLGDGSLVEAGERVREGS